MHRSLQRNAVRGAKLGIIFDTAKQNERKIKQRPAVCLPTEASSGALKHIDELAVNG